jgi:hypothetical protein
LSLSNSVIARERTENAYMLVADRNSDEAEVIKRY